MGSIPTLLPGLRFSDSHVMGSGTSGMPALIRDHGVPESSVSAWRKYLPSVHSSAWPSAPVGEEEPASAPASPFSAGIVALSVVTSAVPAEPVKPEM